MGGLPAYVDPSFAKLAKDEINFWAYAPQATGPNYVAPTPAVVPYAQGPLTQSAPVEPPTTSIYGPVGPSDAFGDPQQGHWVDDFGDVLRNAARIPGDLWKMGQDVVNAGEFVYGVAKDVLDFWRSPGVFQFGQGELPAQGLGGSAMAIGGSRVRYGPWGPVPAVSRLETIAKFGRELTDSEFAAHFGYYPGSGRRRYRRRYGGMRYGTGFRGRRSTGRTRRYY